MPNGNSGNHGINMKMKIFHLCLLVLTFASCQQGSRENEAFQLLDEARACTRNGQFRQAHVLIDSLRATYPRAFDARWAALDFEDSLNLAEAREQAAQADSCLTFARYEYDDLRAGGLPDGDSRVKAARARIDSLAIECDRMAMKIRFFQRKIQEQRDKCPTADGKLP